MCLESRVVNCIFNGNFIFDKRKKFFCMMVKEILLGL